MNQIALKNIIMATVSKADTKRQISEFQATQLAVTINKLYIIPLEEEIAKLKEKKKRKEKN